MSWTAAIIVSEKRAPLVREVILRHVLATKPDQVLVVGDYEPGTGYTYLAVPPLTHSTNDALVKRDVAALACTSEWIAYFCDDHKPAPDFGQQMRKLDQFWIKNDLPLIEPSPESPTHRAYDVFVPARYADQPGPHHGERLNNGEASEYIPNVDQSIGHYCGGHAGVYRKSLIERYPWSAGPHHREWDLLNSRRLMDAGARFCWTDKLRVFDCEPGAEPWR